MEQDEVLYDAHHNEYVVVTGWSRTCDNDLMAEVIRETGAPGFALASDLIGLPTEDDA